MHILLAEDDLILGKFIQYILEKAGHQVNWITAGDLAYKEVTIAPTAYDVLLLDWMLPGKTGIEICHCLRQDSYQKAIMLLTARDDIEDRVTGLDVGADDYLVKPFQKAELLARLRALQRRNEKQLQQDSLQVGPWTLNRGRSSLQADTGIAVALSPREFQLLDLLSQNKGTVVPRDIIFDRIWGRESDVSLNCIDFYVKSLRQKMQLVPGEYIHTVRGVGYKLEE